jgi:SHAQKYF class myb-like DNA-binding protein
LPEEHHRFIEALLKFGNEWKSVQKHVGTRSSTQARSHAQKFFVKIGKTKIENLNLDFANNSLKSLNQMANNFDNEQMTKAIQILNKLAYDKKSRSSNGKDDSDQMSELQINLNDYIDEIKAEPVKR